MPAECPDALTERAEQQLFPISEQTQSQQNVSLNDGLNTAVAYLETVNGNNGITGTLTGSQNLM